LLSADNLSVAGKLAIALVTLSVGLLFSLADAPATETLACAGTQVPPDADLDEVVKADPRDTPKTFCLAAATYVVSSPITLYAGDSLVGPVEETVTRGLATYGVPTAKITDGGANLPRLITLAAGADSLLWLELYGANGEYTNESKEVCANWGEVANKCPKVGTGVAVGSGQTDGSVLMRYLYVHSNDASGISSAKGRILNSHFTGNTGNPDWLGFEGAAIKGVDEFEVANNYIHDEQGNGIWCDVGCDDAPSIQNGFWIHDNLVVNNGRWGIRYENSPNDATGGDRDTRGTPHVTALIERNRVHGNGREPDHTAGGISMHDAQNGTFRANRFGRAKIGGTRYRGNAGGLAVHFADSGRDARTDLWNGDAVRNVLGGETIDGCKKPDAVVRCANNVR